MTFAGLAAKNLMRNRVRAVLTVLGVSVAILTFILLRTVVYAWTQGADAAAKDRVVTRHKVTFVMNLPKRYMEDVRAVPHVKLATFASWFGGKDPKHDHESICKPDSHYLDPLWFVQHGIDYQRQSFERA